MPDYTAWREQQQQRPHVSFSLQYFKQPTMVPLLAARALNCAVEAASWNQGKLGKAEEGGGAAAVPHLAMEYIAHVDNWEEWREWMQEWCRSGEVQRQLAASASQPPPSCRGGTFLRVIFDHNAHEMRGFNRNARAARGRLLVLLQDDTPPPLSCRWLRRILRTFAARPAVGGVGVCTGRIFPQGNPFVRSRAWYRVPELLQLHPLRDRRTGIRAYFAGVLDVGPLALHRRTVLDMGGMDIGLTHRGQCGIMVDWEATFNMWFAGKQVSRGRESGGGGGGVGGGGWGGYSSAGSSSCKPCNG